MSLLELLAEPRSGPKKRARLAETERERGGRAIPRLSNLKQPRGRGLGDLCKLTAQTAEDVRAHAVVAAWNDGVDDQLVVCPLACHTERSTLFVSLCTVTT